MGEGTLPSLWATGDFNVWYLLALKGRTSNFPTVTDVLTLNTAGVCSGCWLREFCVVEGDCGENLVRLCLRPQSKKCFCMWWSPVWSRVC